MPLHHCSAPWAPLLSQLDISFTINPQRLSQSVSDQYLSFWTHFSSAFPEAMWILILLKPTPRRTSVWAIFASYVLPLYKLLLKIQNVVLVSPFTPQYEDSGVVQEEKGILCQNKQAVPKRDGAVTPLLCHCLPSKATTARSYHWNHYKAEESYF